MNETFAREHFPGEDPVGQRIAYDRAATPESTWYEIVGIVGDQHQGSPATPVRAEVFEHAAQEWYGAGLIVMPWLVLRTSTEALAAVPTVREVVRELDPRIPVAEVRPMREVWRASMRSERFVLVLLGAFGAAALLLAVVGVYGVTAQAARRRTREIGIRMALGADGPRVLGMMLRQGLALVVVGVAAGLAASLWAGRALGALLYGVEPSDPATLGAVAVVLSGAALVACWIPAWRALAADPVRSLGAE